jgi:hypothetical protein
MDAANLGQAVELFDDVALDRIIAAVSSAKTSRPLKIDRELFRRALYACVRDYCRRDSFGPKAMNKRLKRFTTLRAKAMEMAALLREDEDEDLDHIGEAWRVKGDGYPPLRPQIRRLIEILDEEKKNLRKTEWRGLGSPVEQLIGLDLPQVFESCFELPAKYGDPSPYVRFVEQFCIEAEIPFGATIVDTALDRMAGRRAELKK